MTTGSRAKLEHGSVESADVYRVAQPRRLALQKTCEIMYRKPLMINQICRG